MVFVNTRSRFLLIAIIKFHLNHYCDFKVVIKLEQNRYVDNWLTSADYLDGDAGMVTESVTIMGKSGFLPAKWGSKSSLVYESIAKDLGSDIPGNLF